MRRSLVLLLLSLVLTAGFAQTNLIVDGREVPGLDQATVAGVSYAPARAYASALGAEIEVGFTTVELRMGGRLLQLRLTGDPARTADPDSVAIDGLEAGGNAALQTETGVLLPVKTVAAAFGGYVTVLGGSRDAVEVRLPTATITGLERTGSGGRERLVVTLSSAVPVRTYFNDRLGILQVFFSRTRQPVVSELEGDAFVQAWFLEGGEEPELRVQLAPGASWSVSSQPAGSGVQLVLAITARAEAAVLPGTPTAGAARVEGRTVLLDPSATTELIDLALAAADELRLAGVEVTLTRTAARGQATTLLGAATADIYLRLEQGTANALSYLGEAASEAQLQQAVTLSGDDVPAVELLRRQLLLGHHGDLTPGAQAAQLLGEQLGIELPMGLPLTGLVPAAGRGVHLTLEGGLLGDPGLPGSLAAGVLRVLEAR